MKRLIVITVLALLLMSTVGAGVVAAKQDENPNLRQAGESSIYFYDVAATDTHGKGKLQINTDEQTFVFNGQGFTPSQQYSLQATAASGDPYVFATGMATPSGNLHIEGIWEAAAAPVEVVAGYPTIAAFNLCNVAGVFVAQLACLYSTDGGVTWKESSHVDGIVLGHAAFAELDNLGVPVGALVKIHGVVVAGDDKTGSELFWYAHYDGYDYYAEYWFSGTTWDSQLDYYGLKSWE